MQRVMMLRLQFSLGWHHGLIAAQSAGPMSMRPVRAVSCPCASRINYPVKSLAMLLDRQCVTAQCCARPQLPSAGEVGFRENGGAGASGSVAFRRPEHAAQQNMQLARDQLARAAQVFYVDQKNQCCCPRG